MSEAASSIASTAFNVAMMSNPYTAVLGAAIQGIGSILGSRKAKQKAPRLASRVNIASEARKALPFNSSILNEATGFTSDVNTAAYQEGERLLQMQIPGLGKLREHYKNQLDEDMTTKGLPKDVEQYLQQKAGEMGVQRGTSGQFNNFNLLRDFGFSMLDHERARRMRTLQTFQSLTNLYPRVNPMSPSSFFLSPQAFVNDAYREQSRMQAHYNTLAKVRNHNAAMAGQTIANIGGNIGGMIAGDAGTANTNTAATIPNYYNSPAPSGHESFYKPVSL